jgi:excisionase family DNA binding protein
MDRLLHAHELAELLAVPTDWVRRQTRAGRIPCVELGRYRRYRLEGEGGVLEWLRKQEAGGGALPRSGAVSTSAGPPPPGVS